MKTTKKLFALLFTLVMAVSMGITAFAANNDGSITITNPEAGKNYEAIKIFDVTYFGENYSYSINSTDTAFATVKAYADDTTNGLTFTANSGTKYIVTVDGSVFSAAKFAAYLKENEVSLGTGKTFSAFGETMKVENLSYGYYFVKGTSGAICELLTSNPAREIYDKNETPDIEKTSDAADSTVEVGQTVNFTITGKVPSTKGYTKYTYKVTDTMTDGLTLNADSIVLSIDGVNVSIGNDNIIKNTSGFELTIPVENYQNKVGKAIVITYSAVVNEKAIHNVKDTNTAKLTYSNNPSTTNIDETEEQKVDFYTFNIAVDKYKSGSEDTKLSGAKFVLKNADGKFYFWNTADKKVQWKDTQAEATEVTTAANGDASFEGLKAGTYYLVETEAPAGYNTLKDAVAVVINAGGSATVGGNSTTVTNTVIDTPVANSTGTILPETGGIGTVIFIVVGALAVIGAGIFLVTNKRMSKEAL